MQAAEGQPCAALIALSRALFGRCSLSLIQLYECACVCVCVFFLSPSRCFFVVSDGASPAGSECIAAVGGGASSSVTSPNESKRPGIVVDRLPVTENDDAPEGAHVPRSPSPPTPPRRRRTHFGSSRTPHTFVRFVLLLSETNGGAGSSSLSALSRALLALSRMLFGRCRALFGRCSVSLIQLCVYVCVFLIFFLLLAVFLSSQMVPVQRDRNASPQWVVAPHRQ